MVKLSKEVYNKLKSVANELNMPMTQVINMLLNDWIKANR